LFDNVGEDADLKEAWDGRRKDGKHDQQHQPNKIVQHELDQLSAIAKKHEIHL
jgi:hypothetical protein